MQQGSQTLYIFLDSSNITSNMLCINIGKLFSLFPPNMCPVILSEIVTEKREKDCDKFPSFLQNKIRSQEFRSCLHRLVRREMLVSGRNLVDDNRIKNDLDKLSDIEIYEVSRLVTYLEYNQERIPKSERIASYFVEEEVNENGKKTVIMYINSASEQTSNYMQELNSILVDPINTITNGLLQSSLHHISLLLGINPDEMHECLNRLKIPGDSECKPNLPCRLKLGDSLPKPLHYLLKHEFAIQVPGDVVALEVKDDLTEDNLEYIVVQVVEQIDISVTSVPEIEYRVNVGRDGIQGRTALDLYGFRNGVARLVDNEEVILSKSDTFDSTIADKRIEFADIMLEIQKF